MADLWWVLANTQHQPVEYYTDEDPNTEWTPDLGKALRYESEQMLSVMNANVQEIAKGELVVILAPECVSGVIHGAVDGGGKVHRGVAKAKDVPQGDPWAEFEGKEDS